jgi:hypothetical protein
MPWGWPSLAANTQRPSRGKAKAPAFLSLSKTFGAMLIARFSGVVYVLHAFQKKSKTGIKTPKEDVSLVHERLKSAQQDYESERKKQS